MRAGCRPACVCASCLPCGEPWPPCPHNIEALQGLCHRRLPALSRRDGLLAHCQTAGTTQNYAISPTATLFHRTRNPQPQPATATASAPAKLLVPAFAHHYAFILYEGTLFDAVLIVNVVSYCVHLDSHIVTHSSASVRSLSWLVLPLSRLCFCFSVAVTAQDTIQSFPTTSFGYIRWLTNPLSSQHAYSRKPHLH